MNKLSPQEQAQVINCLVEGNSIRSTVRMTGVAKNTIQKLLLSVGGACETFQRESIKGVNSTRVQCDEIWAFCYAKEKNVPKECKGLPGFGDTWTFTAIDQDNKMCLTWFVGDRTAASCLTFLRDLKTRINGHIQLTTDAFKGYKVTVNQVFTNEEIDYAMLKKIYGTPWYNPSPNRKYSPGVCTGVYKTPMKGNPKNEDICTSHVERANLTMRMKMRRFTRLTNAFSKKLANMKAAIALHFMHYNYCRIHQTLKVTPAMAAGLTNRAWSIEDVLGLLQEKIKAA